MEQKLEQILENTNRMYRKLKDYHYKAEILGDGSNRLNLELPFEPDLLQVACTDPRIMFHSGAAALFNADLSGLGLAAATYTVTRNDTLYTLAMTTSTVTSRLDGSVLTNIKDGSKECVFIQGLPYQVVATKMDDRTLAQRFTAFVESLTGSGTAQVCKSKVNAAFTAEQWAALKATRPNWTFKEV
jgi:hypothetical protein